MLRRLFAVLALLAAPVTAAEKQPLIPANDLLRGHSNFFKPPAVWDLQETSVCKERLAPLAYKAYSAVGFNLANTIVLVGPDNGLVVVDTLGSEGSAKIALEAIRLKGAIKAKDGKLPIKAIVYTHNHIDHTAGVDGVLALADRPVCPAENTNDAGKDGTYIGRQDCVEVISQKQVVDSVINTGTVVGQMINPRSSYMYGNWIGVNRINDGIGLEVQEGSAGFRMPSRTFTNELLFSAAGINMKLIYVPSETDDEIAAFLPDGMNLTYPGTGKAPRNASSEDGWGGPGMLLSAEVIQGPSFPNLYSLRGTSYRNPAQWFQSVDTLRKLDSWSMVPAHGVPLCGAEDIRVLLRNFRDAVQFTHDQALRRINQGNTPGELAAEIHMPEYLINDLGRMKKPKPDVRTEDYLTAFYGSVPQSVREIYFGYLGWFEADPVALRPTPPRELSRKTVEMMNGPQKVVDAAAASLDKGEKLLAAAKVLAANGEPRAAEEKAAKAHEALQWAAELTTQVIRAEDVPHNAPTVTICKNLTPKFDTTTPWAQCKHAGGTPPSNPPPTCTGSSSYCRAREVKATAFVAMSQIVTNPNWRNWYISSAQELCGLFQGMPPVLGGLTSADIVTALPPSAWVNSWTSRLKAEKTMPHGPDGTCEPNNPKGGVHQSLGFLFLGDSKVAVADQAYALHIRCAIAEFDELQPPVTKDKLDAFEHVDLGISLEYDAWVTLIKSMNAAVACAEKEPFLKALREALKSGGVKVLKGTPQQVESFFVENFDPPQATFQALTLR
ncbi:MAG TPA: alkyl sulfatase dimerization domain-containing protein [Thermoanaerobaculia bacterium]